MVKKLKPVNDQIKTKDKEALDLFLAEHRFLNIIHVYHEDNNCETITVKMKLKQHSPLHYRILQCTREGDIVLHEFYDGDYILELDPRMGVGGCSEL